MLDYGCGYGDLTYAMSTTHSVEGTDFDADRIAFALQQYPALRFQVCTADRLPYPGQSFDIVVSMVVIHFVPHPAFHIRETGRVLKKGGYLILGCQTLPYVRDFLRRLGVRVPSPTKVWVRSKSVINALLEHGGFVLQRTGWFYDPLFTRYTNVMAVVTDLINQTLCLLRVRKTWTYFILLARKTPLRASAPRRDATLAPRSQ